MNWRAYFVLVIVGLLFSNHVLFANINFEKKSVSVYDDYNIIKVTNLNASGEGSLKEAIEANEKRIIVFEVGGVIDLKKTKLVIENPFVVIAGQTAPSPGITLIKGGILITTHNVVIKHISVRPGDAEMQSKSGWAPDGITTYGKDAYEIIIDHCSLTWAVDENLSVSGDPFLGIEFTSRKVTFSNNIIAEGLNNSSHKKGAHSMGSLVHDHCTEISFITNLFANNQNRNPYFKASTTGLIVNNIIFNPGDQAIQLGYSIKHWVNSSIQPINAKLSVVGNILLGGANTKNNLSLVQSRGDVFMEDNLAYNQQMNKLPLSTKNTVLLNEKPFWTENIRPIKTSLLQDFIVQNVGARPKDRDPIDKRIVSNFIAREGSIINSQNDVGGYPPYQITVRKLEIPKSNVNDWLNEYAKQVE